MGDNLITLDVHNALAAARSHGNAYRTPGFLINYGLSPGTAHALIRGGWSTIAELDTAERAWSTATRHGGDCPLHTWLEVPHFGPVAARDLRHALHRWRQHDPTPPPRTNDVNRLAATVRAQIATGEFGQGQPLPARAALARVHAMRPLDVTRTYDILLLAGWCAWRDQPVPADARPRQHAVALLPGRPYDIVWPSTITARARRRATPAAELLRHNPGAWRPDDTSHTLRTLTSITAADFDDRTRKLTITAVTTRQTGRR